MEKIPASLHHMRMVKIQGQDEEEAREVVDVFEGLEAAHDVPMKLKEWNIIPSPVMHKMRQERARLQWTILSKASVALINPFFMVIHPLPFVVVVLIRGLRPVDDVVEERPGQDAARRQQGSAVSADPSRP